MCLERLSIMDDPSSPLELGDGEGDESEDEMRHFTIVHPSESRLALYRKISEWEHRKDETDMSRLPKKSGYHSHETISCEPVEWVTEYAGPYSTRVSVTYRTGADELVTMYENAPPWEAGDLLVENMLAIRGITYPD